MSRLLLLLVVSLLISACGDASSPSPDLPVMGAYSSGTQFRTSNHTLDPATAHPQGSY
jgi:hypothetical protein